ncbi:HupE/UreJ family protein [Larkinella sp. C7]|jgi:ABC-type antimicrobial peptide transport system permease subunit|uniref:HupE/UreJ family protein n=1 Tax=Larkinella sp. C7 TaxID=2576607 RepID=UPI0011112297|nr:HupE/UreJ family protein [Larkinella sp. C7]
MSEFWAYLQLGFAHITDPGGYDHILFVVALCAIYSLNQWKQTLILVTAFTIGHSLTLALATLQLINYSTELIELLIPVTILITAISNFFFKVPKSRFNEQPKQPRGRYVLALLFGLIHGMGFSNYLRSLLGQQSSIIKPLFAFNIGLEFGQIFIVFGVLTMAFILIEILKVRRHDWNLIISGTVAGMALSLIITNPYFA